MDNMDDSERTVYNNVAQSCFKRSKDLRHTYYVVCLFYTCDLFLHKLEKRTQRAIKTAKALYKKARLKNEPQTFGLRLIDF